MKNLSFAAWTGPFVGAVAGAWFGAKGAFRPGGGVGIDPWLFVAGTAIGGAAIGLLIAVLDPRPKDEEALADPYREVQPGLSLVRRVLVLSSVLLCWLPLIGTILAVIAVTVTKGRTDWVRVVCWLAFSIAVLLNGFFLVAALFA